MEGKIVSELGCNTFSLLLAVPVELEGHRLVLILPPSLLGALGSANNPASPAQVDSTHDKNTNQIGESEITFFTPYRNRCSLPDLRSPDSGFNEL